MRVCAWCLITEETKAIEKEHIIPKDVLKVFGPGKWDDEENVWELCVPCHRVKTRIIDGPLITDSWFLRDSKRYASLGLQSSADAKIEFRLKLHAWADLFGRGYLIRRAHRGRGPAMLSPVAKALNHFGYPDAVVHLLPHCEADDLSPEMLYEVLQASPLLRVAHNAGIGLKGAIQWLQEHPYYLDSEHNAEAIVEELLSPTRPMRPPWVI